MASVIDFKPENSEELKRIVAKATENARARNARLKHLKERNELYLAARRGDVLDDDDDVNEEVTKEL